MIDYDKFGRSYTLSVQTGPAIPIPPTLIGDAPFLDVEMPFTINFDVERNTWNGANIAHFEIYNLSQANRNLIRYDNVNWASYREVIFYAGYGTNLPIVFRGSITSAQSVRRGQDFITTIESLDGGYSYTNTYIDLTFVAGTPYTQVFQQIVALMPGVSLGAIGNSFANRVIGANAAGRGNTFSGNAWQILQQLSNGQCFVDFQKVYFLAANECVQGAIIDINPSTGLLNTPERQTSHVVFDMIFEPRISCGQIINLESFTDANFNGPYKVTRVSHRGMISPAVCGEAITTVELDNSGNSQNNGPGNLQVIQAAI